MRQEERRAGLSQVPDTEVNDKISSARITGVVEINRKINLPLMKQLQ
jgi:hypothetical protein